jgi:predicted dehydrogenase
MKRRTFLKKTALGTAAIAGSFYIPAIGRERKLKIGLIGAGWYGMVISEAALDVGGVEFNAVCDVDTEHLNRSAARLEELQGSRPRTFHDYRDLLEMNDLDAVFIASPPQWHALQFIDACEKGFDIFIEKPLSYDPMEGLAMAAAAEKAGNIVAVGFQRRQSAAFQHAQRFIESGEAGEIRKVVAQIHYRANPGDTTIQDPPASLDWDAWCGPAPKLPYRPSIGHFTWRLEKEYGNGHLVDWGIHHIDIIRRTLGLSIPDRIHATGGTYMLKDQITTPDTLNATMQFGDLPVVWQHRMWGSLEENPVFNNGVFYHGDKSSLFVSDNRFITWQTGDETRKKEMVIPTEGGMQQIHMREFIEAVKQRDPSGISSLVADAFKSSATVQLAAISYETGTVVQWDQQMNTVRNNPEAAALLKRPYRGPWVHPG